MITAKEVRERYNNILTKKGQWSSLIGYIEGQICDAAIMGLTRILIQIQDPYIRTKVIKYLTENGYRAFENKYYGHYDVYYNGIVIEW